MPIFFVFAHPNFSDAASQLVHEINITGATAQHIPRLPTVADIYNAQHNRNIRLLIVGHTEVETGTVLERDGANALIHERAAFLAGIEHA